MGEEGAALAAMPRKPTASLPQRRTPERAAVINTRLWPNFAQLELIMKVSPAVNEVNLGFHHVRAR